jgi:hypothetical protein
LDGESFQGEDGGGRIAQAKKAPFRVMRNGFSLPVTRDQ